MKQDESILRRAVRLAMTARGRVEPNPMVGCVLVKGDRVIGEGCHARFGDTHAEPTALASCTESPRGATAYVTLEPCCHTNKKTPPCAPRLIAAGVERVVIGCLDPNPDVDGKGVAMLRQAGIEVTTGVLEAEAKQLIAPFIAATRFARPYVTLKWAQSADGRIAGSRGARRQISGEPAGRAVHELRARCDAILVGVNTVLNDDPMLTARDVPEARPLRRIVLDSRLRTPIASRLVQSANDHLLQVFTTEAGYAAAEPSGIRQLLRAGVELIRAAPGPDGRVSIPNVLRRVAQDSVTHLLVEPGPTLARSFFDAGACDRLWVIQSAKALDETGAIPAPMVPARFVKVGELQLGADTLSEYLDCESDLYFSAVHSADFILAASHSTTPL